MLLRGGGHFTDDTRLTGPLHLSFVRSMVAGGRILQVDLQDAKAAPGVIAVHGARDVEHLGALSVNPAIPLLAPLPFPVLSGDEIRAVGQPLAAVLAETPMAALDAAELIHAEIEEADPGTATVAQKRWQSGDAPAVMAAAAHVVDCTVAHPRLAPSPMEPRAIAVAYHPDRDAVTVWHSTQTPHRTRSELAAILNVAASRIRVIAPHVGGAFGMKASLYPEDVFAVWAAFHHKRDVKWTATRSEDFLSATHGRGLTSRGWLALDGNGRFLALTAEIEAPVGPWLPNSGLIPAWNAGRILPSGYRIATLDITTQAVTGRFGPTGIYRGAGRPEANCLIERLIDKAARKLNIDPVEIRRRNLLRTADLPCSTACGDTLDSGDYHRALEMLCTRAGYDALIADRDRRRADGALTGLGLAFYLEPSGSGWETARVTLNADGAVTVASGSSSQGHARETSYAQIAADTLGVAITAVDVRLADTARVPAGIGALASRSTAIGGSAVLIACRQVAARRAAGETLPITAETRYENDGQAWGYGACLAGLSVCPDTGTPTIEHITCVDDTGTIVNPKLVEGQIIGGLAQGLGEALMERVVHDQDGQLLTGSFMDYAMPRSTDMPPLSLHKFETPSPMNALGAKGVGEAGTIVAPAAVLNAAIDALSPLGVTDLTMPLTGHTLWQAMRDTGQGSAP